MNQPTEKEVELFNNEADLIASKIAGLTLALNPNPYHLLTALLKCGKALISECPIPSMKQGLFDVFIGAPTITEQEFPELMSKHNERRKKKMDLLVEAAVAGASYHDLLMQESAQRPEARGKILDKVSDQLDKAYEVWYEKTKVALESLDR